MDEVHFPEGINVDLSEVESVLDPVILLVSESEEGVGNSCGKLCEMMFC